MHLATVRAGFLVCGYAKGCQENQSPLEPMLNPLMRFIVFVFTVVVLCGPAARGEQPNIVFIFADDWGWGDLGCHGHPYVKTPIFIVLRLPAVSVRQVVLL